MRGWIEALTDCNDHRRDACVAHFELQQEYANGQLDDAGPHRVQLLDGEVYSLDFGGDEPHRSGLLGCRELDGQRLAVNDVDQRAADKHDAAVEQVVVVPVGDLSSERARVSILCPVRSGLYGMVALERRGIGTYCEPTIDQHRGSDEAIAYIVCRLATRFFEELDCSLQEEWLREVEPASGKSQDHTWNRG